MYPFVKRFFDILFAILGILFTFPFVGVIIFIQYAFYGERKLIFRQQRVGKYGKLFWLYKLRTMEAICKVNGVSSPITLSDDPRLMNGMSAFLRKSKLDEFPQFVNILKGELSFVGPRPLIPEIFDLYDDKTKKCIESIRPGVTGMASVYFRNEVDLFKEVSNGDILSFYKKVIAPKKGEMECWYVSRQSFLVDLKILFQTCFPLFVNRQPVTNNRKEDTSGAYEEVPVQVQEFEKIV